MELHELSWADGILRWTGNSSMVHFCLAPSVSRAGLRSTLTLSGCWRFKNCMIEWKKIELHECVEFYDRRTSHPGVYFHLVSTLRSRNRLWSTTIPTRVTPLLKMDESMNKWMYNSPFQGVFAVETQCYQDRFQIQLDPDQDKALKEDEWMN